MQISQSITKILKTELIDKDKSEEWLELLLREGLYSLEEELYGWMSNIYDKLLEGLLSFLSQAAFYTSIQRDLGKQLGLKRLVKRKASIQLRTGTKVSVESLYGKKAPKAHKGTRHLLLLGLGSSDGASPKYKSICCLLSVLCPSFEVSKVVLRHQGIQANYNRIRSLSLALANDAMVDRVGVQLEPKESLKGKHVVIGIDGGRTRTKEYKETKASKRKQSFDTPWREPKMFTITTYDESGKINKESKPIYDGTFGDEQMVALLGQYLKRLHLDQAASVQILADGALWIWNQVIPMLINLGVAKENIIETLDYYHAVEHLNDLKVYLEKEQQDKLFKKLKNSLWKGDVEQMEKLLKKGIPDLVIEEFTPFNYFKKNQHRIDYQTLKGQNRACGSGIIESAIRRIINLRFKSPSTFWFPDNVEKLIFMRGIALSGRWETMMNNLSNAELRGQN